MSPGRVGIRIFLVRSASAPSVRPLVFYIWLPLLVSVLLMGFYFSGVAGLQQLIVPEIAGIGPFSRREFGLLEGLQNGVLIIIASYAVLGFSRASGARRAFMAGMLAVTLFVFLEEIDYGAHITDLLGLTTLEGGANWDRNLHNRTLPGGNQLSHYLKGLANAAGIVLFVLAPLLLQSAPQRLVRWLVPSRWIVATAMLTFVLARLAHWLDDAGLGAVQGREGALHANISEFRELNFYYLVLLYIAGLIHRLDDEPDGSDP